MKIVKAIRKAHYNAYSILNAIIPKRDNYVFFYDAQGMRQNCWELYKYMVEYGYDSKYKLIYYSEKKMDCIDDNLSAGIVSNLIYGWFYHLISKHTFCEYSNFKFNCRPGHKQITVYLTHGMPLKNYGYTVAQPDHPYEDDYSYLLMTSEFYKPLMKKILGCRDNQVYVGGLPRCDQLFHQKDLKWIVKDNCLNVLWMPTFRNSIRMDINDSEKEFPLLTRDSIQTLDQELKNNNINLIIKPHPFQDYVPWLYEGKFTNISIVFNRDIFQHGCELYELIGRMDMLLTDYSSVYSDYLLTQKPIGFVVDDVEEYKTKRGFVDEKLFDLLPGPIITTYEELIAFLNNINNGNDEFVEKRETIQKLLSPQSPSGSFSRDLCEFLNIKI